MKVITVIYLKVNIRYEYFLTCVNEEFHQLSAINPLTCIKNIVY